jgi:hypothetical protein
MTTHSQTTFPLREGLQAQVRDLHFWRRRLNAEVYDALVAECRRANRELSRRATGYDVFRGGDLTEFVASWPAQIGPANQTEKKAHK